ncbi:PLDc_N domain-containing protein [Skermania sp. ID1734]|uniref:PLD nuclease N-terminal domain-containing protein n=1 Tax=Skermania sp. ID1734 TaxID=2597516 RepID=UPI00117FE771|nr:PLD nuclease N-terminal domain-containing protein [Skermania sp. ID1734]TSD97362.1 PLDc_N domain-containing protein [Skermania sp. ID1734]
MTARKKIDPRYRKPLAVLVAVQIALTAAALTDIARRDPDEIAGSKKAWAAAAFVNFIGPLAYFRFGRRGVGG